MRTSSAVIVARACLATIWIGRRAGRIGPIGNIKTSDWALRSFGRIIAATFPPNLRSIDQRKLAQLVISDQVWRHVILGGSTPPSAATVLDHIEDETTGTIAISWLRQRPDDASLVDKVALIVVVDPLGAGRDRLVAALRSIKTAAPTLTLDQARQVLHAASIRARQPVDPYADETIATVARGAVADLLAVRPDLDEDMTRLLLDAQANGASATECSTLRDLLGAGIRARVPDGGRAIAAVISTWRPSFDDADALARAADRGSVGAPTDSNLPGLSRPQAWIRAGRAARSLMVSLLGPAVASSMLAWAYVYDWQSPAATIEPQAAIAILAIAATVNVFTTQLAATRLPGPVARVVSMPGWMMTAYGAAVTATALALFGPTTTRASSAFGWAGVAAAAVFVVSLVAALVTFMSHTDPGSASRAYRRATAARHRAAGRRLGELQGRAAEVLEVIDDLDGVYYSVEDTRVGRRVHIRARRRGFLLPRANALRSQARSRKFTRGDLTLRISAAIGTIVEEGEVIASIEPGQDATVDSRTRRQLARALSVRRVGRIDETTSSSVGLIALSLELAGRGDNGTARAVAQQASLLVAEHVQEGRRARRRELERQTEDPGEEQHHAEALRPGIAAAAAAVRSRDLDPAPVVPALRATIEAAAAARISQTQPLSDIPEQILSAVLAASREAEAAAAMLTFAIPEDFEAIMCRPSAVGDLLSMAATRSMETGDRQTLAIVRDRLRTLSEAEELGAHLRGVASVLCAVCCWVFPSEAHRQVAWFDELTTDAGTAGSRATLLAFTRIGAAALECGMPSVALRCTTIVSQGSRQVADLREYVLSERTRLREEAQSRMRGGYLGDNPSDALKNFMDFAELVQPALAPAVTSS